MVAIKICCFDQSTKCTGYSIWNNGKLKVYGKIQPEEEKGDTYLDRINRMTDEISKIVVKYKPDCVCIEDVQNQNNLRTFKILAQLQGFIFSTLYRLQYPFIVVEPSMWKSFAGINGKRRPEQKQQTIEFVEKEYNIKSPTEDEADAIAIGYWANNKLVSERK